MSKRYCVRCEEPLYPKQNRNYTKNEQFQLDKGWQDTACSDSEKHFGKVFIIAICDSCTSETLNKNIITKIGL